MFVFHNNYSYRATQWPFWFGFLVPFLTLYVFDWIMFIIILVSITKQRHQGSELTLKRMKTQKSNTTKRTHSNSVHKKNFIVALSLAVMFGLGWGFGLLATSYLAEGLTIALQVIFSIFVGAQGFLLFLLHGIRNPDARKLWNKWWTTVSRTTGLSHIISSSTTKSTMTLSRNSGTLTFQRTIPRNSKCTNG